jgi:hypothetical protein
MPKVANSLHRDPAVILKFHLLDRRKRYCNVRNMNPSRNFILSRIKCKSQQIILEGVAYE